MTPESQPPHLSYPLALRFSRRASLALPIAVADAVRQGSIPVEAHEGVATVRVDVSASGALPFQHRNFGTVGIFDVDWLVNPEFSQMLNIFASSPGAISSVRVFGAFTAGQADLFTPDSGGTVWTDADLPIDFARTFDALEALTSRGLIPFVVLGFFPPAVSTEPIRPPMHWDAWKTLVRSFFLQLAADSRFGAERIREWWFEVWNEPNEGRFWQGKPDDYLALYRATSEAVESTGLEVRLGGPAIAYKPEVDPNAGPPWMERFLRFVAKDSALRCDFISLHRKGTVSTDAPDPRRLFDAAEETARLALDIDPVRFAGITIINNEADEKVGFEVPFVPRMDERAASWLGAVSAVHIALERQHQTVGFRFLAAADNANLQLVEGPFDGRRSLVTVAATDRKELIKFPVYGFYEMLRMLGDRALSVEVGSDLLFPETDLYHLPTAADSHVASIVTHYPDPAIPAPTVRLVEYVVDGLPWTRINAAVFQIDHVRSNAYTAAGGSPAHPYPVPELSELPAIRRAQELTVPSPYETRSRCRVVISGRDSRSSRTQRSAYG